MVTWQQYDADIAADTTTMGIRAHSITVRLPAPKCVEDEEAEDERKKKEQAQEDAQETVK